MQRPQRDVVIGPGANPGDLIRAKRAYHLRWRSHDERPRRNVNTTRDKCMRADDTSFTNDRAIKDSRPHADEAVVLHGAGMEDRAMTDRDELAHAYWEIIREMNHATVLNVRTLAYFNVIDVRAQDRRGPDTGAGSKPNVSNDNRFPGHIRSRVNLGLNVEKAGALGRVHVDILPQLRFLSSFRSDLV